MSEWLPISELFDFEKGTLQSSKCTAGEFDFITASSDWKTHTTYTHDCEALIFAMGASGSLGRTHYVHGKFIASDLCFIMTPKKGRKIDLLFYYRIFNFMRGDIVKHTARGTSKLAINQKNFGAYKIPYFDFEHQIAFRDKLGGIAKVKEKLETEFENQAEHLKKLRQAILQEAIEGKLTADWRANNPVIKGDPNTDAQALLAQIQAEKERLIAKGEVKAAKKQESIVDENISEIIPKSWAYPHLDEITAKITDGTHQTPLYVGKGKMFLSAQNVKPFKFMPEVHKLVSEEAYAEYTKTTKAELGDLLVARVGAVGETAVVNKELDFAIYVSLGLIKPIKQKINSNYICIVFNSPYGVRYAKGNVSSLGSSAGNFNLGRIRTFNVPLPSTAEQAAIVEKVQHLLTQIKTLETELKNRQVQTEQLMQAVLAEAFSPSL